MIFRNRAGSDRMQGASDWRRWICVTDISDHLDEHDARWWMKSLKRVAGYRCKDIITCNFCNEVNLDTLRALSIANYSKLPHYPNDQFHCLVEEYAIKLCTGKNRSIDRLHDRLCKCLDNLHILWSTVIGSLILNLRDRHIQSTRLFQKTETLLVSKWLACNQYFEGEKKA